MSNQQADAPDVIHCEHCGEVCEDDFDLQIYHRSCRLKAAFPGTFTQDGGIVRFDVAAIRKQLGMDKKE